MVKRAPWVASDALADSGHASARARANLDEPALRLDHVSITYESNSSKTGGTTVAVQDANLALAQREFVSLIGPSGCGKSSLLHCAGGLLKPTEGEVRLHGHKLAGPRPSEAAFVFQDYSLFHWKSVIDNVAIGLQFGRVRKAERLARAREELRRVGLPDWADAYPSALSGGMQQRVAVARGLAMDPDVLLLDEPFGALDEISRRNLGVEMSGVLHEAGKSIVLVTHSLDEAIYWADRVIVMSPRPGNLIAEIPVRAERPRPWNFVTSAECDEIRAQLLELLTTAPAASKEATA